MMIIMNRLFTLLLAASCFTAVGQVPDYVPTDGLVAWYPFNGNAADESGNGNDGVAVDVEDSEDRFGHSNAAFFFSSAGCQPRVDAQIDMTSVQSEMTFSFWMSRSGNGCISPRVLEILGSDGAYLQASVSNNSSFFGFDGGISAPEPIQSDTWYHMLITIDETGYCAFYQNGSLVDSGLITPTGIPMDVSKLNGDIAIGRMNHSAWDAFRGIIDDVALWNRVITEEEVQALYNAVAPLTGCIDLGACNYDLEAVVDDGSCLYVDNCGECGGDGVSGCTDSYACNFDAEAACDNGNCDYSCCPGPECCGEGMFWDWDLEECVITNPADINFDGCVQLNDLLDLLSAYGNCSAEESVWQCGDPLEYQGYDYETVQIGEQCWFAENLRAENYRNGEEISSGLSVAEWSSTIEGATSIYAEDLGAVVYSGSSDVDSNLVVYGRVYNGHAVMDSRELCPVGWDVPTYDDWITIQNHLGGEAIAGLAMKANYTWDFNGGGDNSSGFTGLAGGRRRASGNYNAQGGSGYWWSRTENLSGNPTSVYMTYQTDELVIFDQYLIETGLSIRCLKNAE